MSKFYAVSLECDTSRFEASTRSARVALQWIANIRLISHFGLLDQDEDG